MEDRKAPLIKAVFSDLHKIKAKGLELAIFKIGSSVRTKNDFREGWKRITLND
jgi:hypothetical protein